MQFASAFFKLGPSKCFSKKISWLLLSRNEFYLDCVIFNLLTGEMIINFEVLGFFMEDWVVAKFNATLIVAENVGRLVVQEFEFFQ